MEELSAKPAIVLGIILNKRNQVLVGQVRDEKKDEDFHGFEFVFPGGLVEFPESSEEAVARAVYEECNLKVIAVILIRKRKYPNEDGDELFYYHCIIENEPSPAIKNENQDIRKFLWVDIDRLDRMMPALSPEVKAYLQQFI